MQRIFGNLALGNVVADAQYLLESAGFIKNGFVRPGYPDP
jgi:hypothetical protein